MTRNLAHRLSASIYAILDNNDFKTDALADTTTKCTKYKNDARNEFSMPELVGKVVLHSFRYQSVFKLHFQYGHRRPFWILASHKFRRHFREGHGG